jgi:hypothetical protein
MVSPHINPGRIETHRAGQVVLGRRHVHEGTSARESEKYSGSMSRRGFGLLTPSYRASDHDFSSPNHQMNSGETTVGSRSSGNTKGVGLGSGRYTDKKVTGQ